jgi:hypothetical protein
MKSRTWKIHVCRFRSAIQQGQNQPQPSDVIGIEARHVAPLVQSLQASMAEMDNHALSF